MRRAPLERSEEARKTRRSDNGEANEEEGTTACAALAQLYRSVTRGDAAIQLYAATDGRVRVYSMTLRSGNLLPHINVLWLWLELFRFAVLAALLT